MKKQKMPFSFYLGVLLIGSLSFPYIVSIYMFKVFKDVTPYGIVTLIVNGIATIIVAVCLALQIKLERKNKAQSLNGSQMQDSETNSEPKQEEQPVEPRNGEEQTANSTDENKEE